MGLGFEWQAGARMGVSVRVRMSKGAVLGVPSDPNPNPNPNLGVPSSPQGSGALLVTGAEAFMLGNRGLALWFRFGLGEAMSIRVRVRARVRVRGSEVRTVARVYLSTVALYSFSSLRWLEILALA